MPQAHRTTASSRFRRSAAFTQIAFASTLRQLRLLANVRRKDTATMDITHVRRPAEVNFKLCIKNKLGLYEEKNEKNGIMVFSGFN